jgi:hypothetical protein
LKDRQYNGEKKTDEKTNNDLQNTTQKTAIIYDYTKFSYPILYYALTHRNWTVEQCETVTIRCVIPLALQTYFI